MNIISIDLAELRRLKLDLNEYLTLLNKANIIDNFKYGENEINKLIEKKYLNKIGETIVLAPKAVVYFQAKELFREFFDTFPHTVPDRGGEERPLRTASIETEGAAVTGSIWRRKVKGNINLQERIIEVLRAEIDWRMRQNTLQYMHNIDTWLRQNDYEKYDYLLNTNHINNRI